MQIKMMVTLDPPDLEGIRPNESFWKNYKIC